MATKKYLKINGVLTNYTEAQPVECSFSTSAPAQSHFFITLHYTSPWPTVGQSIEWFTKDDVKRWDGVIATIEATGIREGDDYDVLEINAVGKDDRMFRRTTWNRTTFRCAQYRSWSGTVDTNDVSGTGHVYWVDGDKFTKDLVGKTVVINGSNYSVTAVVSPIEFTVFGSLGSHSSVVFTMTTYSGDVARDLILNYCDFEGFTFTGTSIQNGAALDSKGILFDPPVTIHDAFQTLLGANPDYYLDVDVNQVVYFAPRTTVSAPADFTPTSGQQKRGLRYRITAEDVRNCEISQTTWDAVNETTESITGDGTTQAWFLAHDVAIMGKVFLNGVEVNVAEETSSSAADFYYTQNYSGIWQDPANPPLTSGDTLEVNYKRIADNLIEYADDAARLARAIIEGSGFGRYEQSIDRTKLSGKTAALADATNSVNRLKHNHSEITIQTFELGYRTGQVMTVTIPKLQISAMSMFIDEVQMSDASVKGTSYDFEYTLRCIAVSRRITENQILRDAFSVGSGGGGGSMGGAGGGGGGGSAAATITDTTLTADATIEAPRAPLDGEQWMAIVRQDSTGGWAVTWGSAVAPILAAPIIDSSFEANTMCMITFYGRSGKWYTSSSILGVPNA